jgi:hypothetical protein
MDTREMRSLPAGLEAVRRKFERWRATREGRASIPDRLWASAALAAAKWGISRTAGALRVNSSRLKQHLGTQAAAVSGGAEAADKAHFVELPPFTPNGSCECLLELEDGSGAKMRIQFRSTAAPDLAAIGRSFWNRQP